MYVCVRVSCFHSLNENKQINDAEFKKHTFHFSHNLTVAMLKGPCIYAHIHFIFIIIEW